MSVKKFLGDGSMKHRKRAKSKGAPRADHKHIYETVLLHHHIQRIDCSSGKQISEKYTLPTKICTLCGRVSYVDQSPELYVKVARPPTAAGAILRYQEQLSEKALSLPEWHTTGYLGKYAARIIDVEFE